MLLRPTLRDVLRFGRHQVADQVGPGGLPWDSARQARADFFDPSTDIVSADQVAFYRQTYTDAGSGKVSPWTDLWTGEDLTQGTAANRPTITASDTDFDGFPSFTYDGVNDGMIAPAATEADWKPLHDYTGVLVWMVFYPTGAASAQILIATCSSAVQIGCRVTYNGTDESIALAVANGVTDILSVTTANGSFPLNRKHRLCFWVKDGLAPSNEFEIWGNNALWAQGTVTGSASSADPTSRILTGRTPGGASFYTGKMAELGITKNISHLAGINNYMQRRYPS